ncbi:nicotinamide riboside kinase 1 [Aricia agestis]|uniref:nicotinamide riboside kinase 1 n=1 Tax=Aricia agestis TaxID=91739 RepID=UPI001C2048D6|nr:nicotinamide riboside kinase 1 [Aricia agestis]
MMSRQDWIIIGIAGVTCGGKTTISNKLKDTLSPVYIFHQDQYFYPDDSPNHVKCEGLEHNNYDILSSLDMNKMYEDVLKTMNGENKAHTYNENSGSGKLILSGKKFIIVEGFTVLNFEPINEICDLRYYLVLTYEECVRRRGSRVYDPPDIPGYFEQCVWPEHKRYRQEIEKDKRIAFLDGSRPDNFESIVSDLKEKGAKYL